ncbi:XRE family transcriptional regulator [Saccharopolyspora hattusasensis]|uniref:XRE family transcriptional regulator n=1 Tax=Saccharopolyspora hattusasensis TaxID=1128679 RepID=UPI003D992797
MSEPNDQLRHARERVESPNATGEPLSRQELADLVNRWVYEHTNPPRVIALDANYIGKLEQGKIRWPQDDDRRAALRAVLNARTDQELGFRRPRRSRSTVADVDRQQFLRAAVGAGAAAVVGHTVIDMLAPTEPTPVPTVVGTSEVADVRAAAQAFSGWDARYGGGLVREAVAAQLRYSAELLNGRCAPAVRNDLFSAVGYLAHVTGFMAFDAYAHEDARSMFGFALGCAEEAGDWHLRAKILSSMARQAIWCGDPDTGLTYTELALVRADRLVATERAMLHTARARALGKLGRIQDTLTAVGLADESFDNANPTENPPWMAYYDAAQHAGDTGHALWELGVSGQFITEARTRLASSVSGHSEAHARSRVISQTKLASLTMVAGDPTEAAHFGAQALQAAGPIKSRRAADDLRELRRASRPHAGLDEVGELCSRIGSAVVTA